MNAAGKTRVSVVVPLYNEGARVHSLLAALRRVEGLGEVVLADASDDAGSKAAVGAVAGAAGGSAPVVRLINCAARGRAVQMNAGAATASGEVLLFLHCDTKLPADAAECIARAAAAGRCWGWFDLRLDAGGARYRLLEWCINRRARWSRIPTGDQAVFVAREVFVRLGGFAEIALMEDVALARRLKGAGTPAVLRGPVLTSARRWQQGGFVRTVLLMWRLRFLYWLGGRAGRPARLAAVYPDVRDVG